MLKRSARIIIAVMVQLFFFYYSSEAQSKIRGLSESKTSLTPVNKEQAYKDSLENELARASADTVRSRLLGRLDQAYVNSNPARSQAYEQRRLEIGLRIKDLKIQTYAYINLSRAAIYQNNMAQAKEWLKLGLAITEKEKDSADMAKALINLGAVCQGTGNNTAALDYFIRAARVTTAIHDSAYSNISNINIAAIYYGEDNYSRAEEYIRQTLPLIDFAHDPLSGTKAYELLGNIYVKQKKFSLGREYYMKTIALYQREHNDMGTAIIYSHMTGVYLGFQDDSALYYALKAKEIFDRINPNYFVATQTIGNLGSIYYAMAIDSIHHYHQNKIFLLHQAERYLDSGMKSALKTNRFDDIIAYDGQLSSVQHLLHEDVKALMSLRQGYNLNDSLYSQDVKNKLASADEKYQVQLREDQLAASRKTLAIQARQRYYLIAGIALLAVIGGLLYWQNRTRTKVNRTLIALNSKLDQANEVKTRFMGILNHDLRAPVTNLINILHLKKEAPGLMDETKTAAHSERIRGQAVSLLETMEDLLSWSKGQMKNFQPQRKDIAAGDLFADIKNTFSGTPEVTLQFSDPDLTVFHTDEYFLKTIMRNLTSNAIKSLKNNPAGHIQWTAFMENGQKMLSVTDNGPGISDEALKPLYDESMPSTLKSGLGLHLVRDLAKIISCRITVQTSTGGGTRFLLSV